jgi:predicted GNAT family acetyltransferase
MEAETIITHLRSTAASSATSLAEMPTAKAEEENTCCITSSSKWRPKKCHRRLNRHLRRLQNSSRKLYSLATNTSSRTVVKPNVRKQGGKKALYQESNGYKMTGKLPVNETCVINRIYGSHHGRISTHRWLCCHVLQSFQAKKCHSRVSHSHC